ncbi:MAG: argininosuccinate lyase [Bacteroidales bacterium]
MKLWDKGIEVEKLIEKFTIGKDNELDLQLAEFDVLGTIAHIRMLQKMGVISELELKKLEYELIRIYGKIKEGSFRIEEGVEDVHSQIEMILTDRLGDIGKKVHTGRSRNDQVLVDLKLFIRHEIWKTVEEVKSLFNVMIEQSEKHKHILLPGYTHFQIAMPSSFGLWFGAYAESLIDDLQLLLAAYKINNQNPLGSGAGYGSSFPLDRSYTTQLLGFDTLSYNVVNAQMARGKVEKIVAFSLASVGSTLSRLAMDACLFSSQNFKFISFPDNLTTGSSIMPHKKNPDVFELVRARCNRLQGIPAEIGMILGNLPSGYHRDMQVIKETFIPVFEDLRDSVRMTELMLRNVIINEHILDDDKYNYLFTVEEVNRLVLEGVPFRDAYKQVARSIQDGTFKSEKAIRHTHEGSMGNLCNAEIRMKMDTLLAGFEFQKMEASYANLLQETKM